MVQLQAAYAELVTHFDEARKSNKYAGIDGLMLTDLETNASSLLQSARQELAENIMPDPVRTSFLPKPDGTLRAVYLFSFKDRLKIQAIHRVVAPLIEAQLSPFLFSYRPGRSHHQAARSVAKRHRAYFQSDTVARLDLKKYIEYLDHDVLRTLMPRFGIDEAVGERILRFAAVARWEEGNLQYAEKGSLAGNSLTPLLQNVYLNDVDMSMGRQAALYRRVGDDIVICDQDAQKVQRLSREIMDVCAERKLFCNQSKTALHAPGEPFKFVGYKFSNGLPSIESNGANRIRLRFNRQLPLKDTIWEKKIRLLPQRWFVGMNSLHAQFIEVLKSYPCANDDRQIQDLSQQCVHRLVCHLFGQYSPRNHRQTTALLKTLHLPTLYDYFCELRYGHARLGPLAASAPRRYQNARAARALAV